MVIALTAADWFGLAGVVTAFFGGIASVIGAVAATRANTKVSTSNGVTLGEAVTNVAAAVTTPPDAPPLGELAATAAETVERVHDAVAPDDAG